MKKKQIINLLNRWLKKVRITLEMDVMTYSLKSMDNRTFVVFSFDGELHTLINDYRSDGLDQCGLAQEYDTLFYDTDWDNEAYDSSTHIIYCDSYNLEDVDNAVDINPTKFKFKQSRNYDQNEAMADVPCLICGKHVEKEEHFVHLTTDGCLVDAEVHPDSQGFFSIGGGCARKLPSIFVFNESQTRKQKL